MRYKIKGDPAIIIDNIYCETVLKPSAWDMKGYRSYETDKYNITVTIIDKNEPLYINFIIDADYNDTYKWFGDGKSCMGFSKEQLKFIGDNLIEVDTGYIGNIIFLRKNRWLKVVPSNPNESEGTSNARKYIEELMNRESIDWDNLHLESRHYK